MNWTPDRWNAAQTILDAALDLPQAERTAYVTEHAPDVDTREALLGLLAREPELPTMLSGSAVDLRTLLEGAGLAPPVQQGMPERVGVYRPVRLIGRGGMGVVYLAERADGQFEQTVALKLSAAGLAADVQRRFEDERRILARLSHPHIARLLGGGLFEGRPYFAMEYVEGEPITTYAERLGLSIEARVRLFRDVCAAVGYAHRNLIVHRDLKPSNVLVTQAGEVKLLDFGIARLLEDDADRTQTGERWMTPGYAAPEQIRGESITTATDVYGLGALLYALLTGSAPRGADAAAFLDDFVPPRPSTALASGNGGEAARERSRRVRGDLDHIVLKALRADPSRRYASAEALSDDLDRHLRQVPVAARPERPAYVARRFVRRNRGVVAAAAIALVFVVVLTAFYVVGLSEARSLAEREAERAQQTASFLGELFRDSRPSETLGRDVTAKQMLITASQRLPFEFASDPNTRADLSLLLGKTFAMMGAYPLADSLMDIAETTYGALGNRACALAQAQNERITYAFRQHDYPEADRRAALAQVSGCLEEEFSLALIRAEMRDESGVSAHESDSTARRLLGKLESIRSALTDLEYRRLRHSALGRATEAAALNGDAARADSLIGLTLELPDLPATEYATTVHLRGVMWLQAGRPDLALPHLEESTALTIQFYGATSSDAVQAQSNLAAALTQQGRLEEALMLIRKSLASEQAGLARPGLLANIRMTQAVTLQQLGRMAEAEAMFIDVLSLEESLYGPDHRMVGVTVYNLAALTHELGRLSDAERYARRVLAIDREVYGATSFDHAVNLTRLASILRDQNRLVESERAFAEGQALFTDYHSAAKPRWGDHLAHYALLRLLQNRTTDAVGMATRGEALLAESAPDHWRMAHARYVLGTALARSGERERGRALLRESAERLAEVRGGDNVYARAARTELSRL